MYCPCTGQIVVNTSGWVPPLYLTLEHRIPWNLSVVLETYTEKPKVNVEKTTEDLRPARESQSSWIIYDLRSKTSTIRLMVFVFVCLHI